MADSIFHRTFAQMRRWLPKRLSKSIRGIATAVLFPFVQTYRTGHFRSSLRAAAVNRRGEPLPWYTYPCIDFLRYRDYVGKTVLEFGGGQSTLWWASKAKSIVTLEGDPDWYSHLSARMPANVDLQFVEDSKTSKGVEELLEAKGYSQFDIVIIDGLARYELIEVACRVVAPDGFIICDNAEGYKFYEGFKDRRLRRVDFYGSAPGVLMPHCTSICGSLSSFIFDPRTPIHAIADEH